MGKDDAVALLQRQAEAVRALGATSLYLFGSTVRDTAEDDSDLDLFIDYDGDSRFSLLDLVGIKQFLEERLNMKVDVTTRDSLHPLIKDRVEASAFRVF